MLISPSPSLSVCTVDLSLVIGNESTLFVESSTNHTVEISAPYPASSQLVWYHNAVELVEQRGRVTLTLPQPASNDTFGVYQCFVSVPGLPQVLTKSARVMPTGEWTSHCIPGTVCAIVYG